MHAAVTPVLPDSGAAVVETRFKALAEVIPFSLVAWPSILEREGRDGRGASFKSDRHPIPIIVIRIAPIWRPRRRLLSVEAFGVIWGFGPKRGVFVQILPVAVQWLEPDTFLRCNSREQRLAT